MRRSRPDRPQFPRQRPRSLLKVMKFGGTSVGSAPALRQLVRIVQAAQRSHRVVVVASALSGVTNTLVAALSAAEAGTLKPETLIRQLRDRHLDIAAELLHADGR